MRDQPEDHGIQAVIDGEPLSLFVDYDRPRLTKLSAEGKVEYFQRRFQFVVLDALAVLLEENDKKRYHDEHPGTMLIVWANSVFCAIETLGHFLTPKAATNAQAFHTFVAAYMDASWQETPQKAPPNVDTYARWLWDSFRNGLAHGAYVKHGGFEKLGDRLFVEFQGSLKVDPWAFDIEFRGGVRRMVMALKQPDNQFRPTFLVRFDRTYIEGET